MELFGQYEFLKKARPETSPGIGVLVVEGPNDVIRMSMLGRRAVGLCSNRVSKEQGEEIVRLAREHAEKRVTLMLDNDLEGESGARQALWEIANRGAAVRLAWSRSLDGGKYTDRQPESLTEEEWQEILARL